MLSRLLVPLFLLVAVVCPAALAAPAGDPYTAEVPVMGVGEGERDVAIARAQLTRGKPTAARRALLRALKRDPENETARALLENDDL